MDIWLDGLMDGHIDRISPHSTRLWPLLVPLTYYPVRLHNIEEAGQGNCRPLDAFGRLIDVTASLALGPQIPNKAPKLNMF